MLSFETVTHNKFLVELLYACYIDKYTCPFVIWTRETIVEVTWKFCSLLSTGSLMQDSEVFTAMEIQVAVFCVVTPCSDAVRYQRFEGP
jgi:hypothetical protein